MPIDKSFLDDICSGDTLTVLELGLLHNGDVGISFPEGNYLGPICKERNEKVSMVES